MRTGKVGLRNYLHERHKMWAGKHAARVFGAAVSNPTSTVKITQHAGIYLYLRGECSLSPCTRFHGMAGALGGDLMRYCTSRVKILGGEDRGREGYAVPERWRLEWAVAPTAAAVVGRLA